MIKSFSETISVGKTSEDHFQTEFELRAWARIVDPRKILSQIPEKHWTGGQRAIINQLSVEEIKKLPEYLHTKELKERLRAGRKKSERERLLREVRAGAGEGDWSRWKRAGKWHIGFPGLTRLARRGQASIAEIAVEKIEKDLNIGRREIGLALKKAAAREKLTEIETKVMRRIIRLVPMVRSIRWAEFGEYYHPSVGWY